MRRRIGMLLVAALLALMLGPRQGQSHSDASSFASPDQASGHHHHDGDARTAYPATVIIDPQKVTNVVLKVNARVKRVLAGFVGQKVTQGQVLAEFESAELATLQQTFIETVANREAMVAFSTTGEEKILEGRMNLRWRGLSDGEIDRIEKERKPIETVEVVSPFDGTIVAIDASASRIVSAGSRGGLFSSSGTTLFRIAAGDALLVEARIPAGKASSLQPGATVELSIPGPAPQTKLSGTVEKAVTFANPQNGSVTMRIRPDAESGRMMMAGQLLQVVLEDENAEGHHHD